MLVQVAFRRLRRRSCRLCSFRLLQLCLTFRLRQLFRRPRFRRHLRLLFAMPLQFGSRARRRLQHKLKSIQIKLTPCRRRLWFRRQPLRSCRTSLFRRCRFPRRRFRRQTFRRGRHLRFARHHLRPLSHVRRQSLLIHKPCLVTLQRLFYQRPLLLHPQQFRLRFRQHPLLMLAPRPQRLSHPPLLILLPLPRHLPNLPL